MEELLQQLIDKSDIIKCSELVGEYKGTVYISSKWSEYSNLVSYLARSALLVNEDEVVYDPNNDRCFDKFGDYHVFPNGDIYTTEELEEKEFKLKSE
jgi:hypothetical protein